MVLCERFSAVSAILVPVRVVAALLLSLLLLLLLLASQAAPEEEITCASLITLSSPMKLCDRSRDVKVEK
jgi:hypothetical protein